MSVLLCAFNKSIANELTDRVNRGEFPDLPWSTEQQPVRGWFHGTDAEAPRTLVVIARAGTGKTTTIMGAVSGAPEADEIVAKTLHSLGYSIVRKFWERVRIDNGRAWSLALRAANGAPDAVVKLISKLHTKGREIVPLAKSGAELQELAIRFDCEPDEEWAEHGLTLKTVCDAAHRAMVLAEERPEDGRIDFADMVYLPVRLGWARPMYDMVVVDEAQDMNPVLILLAKAVCRDRLVVVGDDRQCHPPGTMIATDSDSVPVEELQNGDTVQGWNRNAQKMIGGRRCDVARRHYDGLLYHMNAAGRETAMTPDHRVLCRWTDRTAKTCVVYLMWRQGYGFRVGWCQLFSHSRKVHIFHLAHRARIEKADRTWVLECFEDRTEASIAESVYATNYGLPTITFEPVHGARHLTRASIDEAFSRFGRNLPRGLDLLRDRQMSFDLPLYPWPGMKLGEPQGRRTYFEVYAANLIPGLMSVPLPDGQNRWEPIAGVSHSDYSGPVYSLDVETDHSYSANGLVVRNCIYSFRGAESDILHRLAEERKALTLHLTTTYRCAQAIVEEAAKYVPDFRAGASNPAGLVDELDTALVLRDAQHGDAILSRTNAPLISLALKALRQGIPAVVAGKDVAAGLRALIKRLATGKAKTDVTVFLERLTAWQERETERAKTLPERMVGPKMDKIWDQADALRALADGVVGIGELYARIDKLFKSIHNGTALHLSSVHKAKGLEWERVFLLATTLRSGEEEENIAYVGITRAMKRLTMVY